MKKYLLTIIIFIVALNSWAQDPFYKQVGQNKLPYPALDACFDTTGNLYVVCASADSVYSFFIEKGIDTWEQTGSIAFANLSLNPAGRSNVKCFYLKQELYIILNATTSIIYRESGTSFIQVAELADQSAGNTRVDWIETNRGKAYLFGNFNLIDQLQVFPNIAIFDSSNFSSPSGVLENGDLAKPFLRNDTIFFLPQSNKMQYINTLSDSSSWLFQTTFKLSVNSSGVSGDDEGLYYFDFEPSLPYGLNRNERQGSLPTFTPFFEGSPSSQKEDLHYTNGRLYFTKAYDKTIFEKVGNNIKAIKPPLQQVDTIQGYLISQSGSDVYYIPKTSMGFAGGTLNIAKLSLDSADYYDYDSIYLKAFLDNDLNGVYTATDSNVNGTFTSESSSIITQIRPANDSLSFVLLRAEKEYTFFANSYDLCVEPTFNGGLRTDNLANNKTSDTLNFPFQSKPINSDIRVNFYRSQRARLNDTISNIVEVRQRGCYFRDDTAYCKVVLAKNTNFVSSVPSFRDKTGDTLYYIIGNVPSQGSRQIEIETSYSNTLFSIDDKVTHHAYLYPSSRYQNETDQDSLITTMVYSYDPNEKIAQPSGIVTKEVDKIKYTIHFENEGNDVARRVIIKDTIDTRMPVVWFRMINSSHPYTVTVRNNVVTWTFDNINLAGKSEDPKASQGYVSFEAKVSNPMAIGDSIRNKASIYFDLNDAIVTNYATLRRIDNPDNLEKVIKVKDTLKVYPNPASTEVHIKNLQNHKHSLVLYDIKGALIKKIKLEAKEEKTLPLEGLSKGMYFINLDGANSSFKLMVH